MQSTIYVCIFLMVKYCTYFAWANQRDKVYCIFYKVARVKINYSYLEIQYSYANKCCCSRCEIPICHNSNYIQTKSIAYSVKISCFDTSHGALPWPIMLAR